MSRGLSSCQEGAGAHPGVPRNNIKWHCFQPSRAPATPAGQALRQVTGTRHQRARSGQTGGARRVRNLCMQHAWSERSIVAWCPVPHTGIFVGEVQRLLATNDPAQGLNKEVSFCLKKLARRGYR